MTPGRSDRRRNGRAGQIGSLDVMADHPAPPNSRLDAATAERLLSTAAGLPGYPRLAELLAAAAASDSSESLPGTESAIAAYRRDATAAKAVGTSNLGRAF